MTSGARSADSDGRAAAAELPLASLVSLLQARLEPGASRAAAEIGRRFGPLLRRYWLAHRCGDYADFEQEAFKRLFGALPRLRSADAFPGLFRQIVIGTAADHWRQHPPAGVPMTDEEQAAIPDPAAHFTDELAMRLMVRTYMTVLPARERQVVELLYFADLDVDEAARALGITPGAVRTTRVRALSRLREAMRNV